MLDTVGHTVYAPLRQGGDVTQQSEAPEAESLEQIRLSTFTFLLSDIRGYTTFTYEHGDAAAAHLSEAFLEICRDVVCAHDGIVFGTAGDQALSVFESALAALRAAVALQERLQEERERDPKLPLFAGVGLDSGGAARVGTDYRGSSINRAARLCGIADKDQILATGAVVDLARCLDGLDAIDRGVVSLKGFPQPVKVLQIGKAGLLPAVLPPLQPTTPANNLPDEVTPFIGRGRLLLELSGLVSDPRHRLITLTGPGGTGKTRMGLHVATSLLNKFEDGVFFIECAALTDASLLPSVIAKELKINEEGTTELGQTVIEKLQKKHMLLVIDNVEQIIDSGLFVARLLAECRKLHVLVTSRVALRVAREHEFQIPPLLLPHVGAERDLQALIQNESIALFVDRAIASSSHFKLTPDNARGVIDICTRLDGLPLAIELAAARIKAFTPEALLQRLESRLKFLTGGARDRPTRQQTLRGAIDWSYTLLSDAEKELFARLSVFTGGFTFEAAEAISGDDSGQLLGSLMALVDNSLAFLEGPGANRYRMLETIREYARDALGAGGHSDVIREKHAHFFLAQVESFEAELRKGQSAKSFAELDAETDNLRSAMKFFLETQQLESEVRLASALERFWSLTGRWSEGRRWIESGIAPDAPVNERTRAKALFAVGCLAFHQGDYSVAEEVLERGRSIFRLLGNMLETVRCTNVLGSIAWGRADFARARAYYEECLRLSADVDDVQIEAAALNNLGLVAIEQQDFETARKSLQLALARHRSVHDRNATAVTLENLGIVALERGEPAEAEKLFEEGLAIARDLGAKKNIAHMLCHLGEVAIKRGATDRALSLLREGLSLLITLGDRHLALVVIGQIGNLVAAKGDAYRAIILLASEAQLREQLRIPFPPMTQAQSEEAKRVARETLLPNTFDEAWKRGCETGFDDAVALALQ